MKLSIFNRLKNNIKNTASVFLIFKNYLLIILAKQPNTMFKKNPKVFNNSRSILYKTVYFQ